MKHKFDDATSYDTGSKLESMTSEQRIESLNYLLYMIAGLVILVFLIGITLHIKKQNSRYTHKRLNQHKGPEYKQMSLLTKKTGRKGKEYVLWNGGTFRQINKQKSSLIKNSKEEIKTEVYGIKRNSRAIIHPLH